MRCLVTGAAGFIGSALSSALIEDGHDVVGFDNLSTGELDRLDDLRDSESFDLVVGDLRNESDVNDAVANVEYIFHQAAVPSVARSVRNPRLTTEANCLGTTNLLTAAKDGDVNKVVVASSSSVYGSDKQLPNSEDMDVSPESPYALSKYWTEKLALQFNDLYGLSTVALRYFNIFGPGQSPEGEYAAVIPKFVNLMLDGQRPIIYGDGEQSRDFTYVRNAVDANRLAADSSVEGEMFNVACGQRTTINELVEKINEILGTEIQPMYDDPRPGDVRHSEADISKANELLGYSPEVGFDEGLERTVEYFRDYHN